MSSPVKNVSHYTYGGLLFCIADPNPEPNLAYEVRVRSRVLFTEVANPQNASGLVGQKLLLFINWQKVVESFTLNLRAPLRVAFFRFKIKNNGPIGHSNYVSAECVSWDTLQKVYMICMQSAGASRLVAEFNFSCSVGGDSNVCVLQFVVGHIDKFCQRQI